MLIDPSLWQEEKNVGGVLKLTSAIEGQLSKLRHRRVRGKSAVARGCRDQRMISCQRDIASLRALRRCMPDKNANHKLRRNVQPAISIIAINQSSLLAHVRAGRWPGSGGNSCQPCVKQQMNHGARRSIQTAACTSVVINT